RRDYCFVSVEYEIAIAFPHMRLRNVADLIQTKLSDLASSQPSRLEDLTSHELLIRHAGCSGSDFASDDVEEVVVVIVRAKAVCRLQILQPRDDVSAREVIRLRPQHQIASAFR